MKRVSNGGADSPSRKSRKIGGFNLGSPTRLVTPGGNVPPLSPRKGLMTQSKNALSKSNEKIAKLVLKNGKANVS